MPKRSRFLHSVSATLFVALLLAGGLSALAQSGRRVKKSVPAPVATPEATPTVAKPAEKEKPRLPLLVGIDRYLGFSTIPLSYYETVTRGCAERLDDATAVKVEIVHGELSRSDAVRRAKAEKEGFVVWLQLRVETANADTNVVNDLSQLYIEYWVFAATTAKTVATGHSYQQGYRKGGVVVMPPASGRGSVGYNEYRLREAARQAAESILDKLRIMPQGNLSATITAPAFVPLRRRAH